MMVRAVLFDLFETLVTESRNRPPGVSSLAAEFGCEGAAFRAEWRKRRPHVTTGRLSFGDALGAIASTLGQPADGAMLRRACDERIRRKQESISLVEPQILAMLDELRTRGVRLGLVSNCFAEDVAGWPTCPLRARFDCVVFSFEVGLAKPDPLIYLEATRRLQIDAAECWFVGDDADGELAGAAQADLRAFRAVWFLTRWPHFVEGAGAVASVVSCEELLHMVQESRPAIDDR